VRSGEGEVSEKITLLGDWVNKSLSKMHRGSEGVMIMAAGEIPLFSSGRERGETL